MFGRQRRAGEIGLDAAASSAIAAWRRLVFRICPRQWIMAPLAGNRVDADERLPTDDEARAGAGPEDDAEHDLGTSCSAVCGFRYREAIRIVGNAHRTAKHGRQIVE